MQGQTMQSIQQKSVITSGKCQIKQSLKKEEKQVKFDGQAKVCDTPSPYSVPLLARNQIWWQRNELDDFRKAARIITKEFITCKSEIWLWDSKQEHDKQEPVDEEEESESDDELYGSKWWCRFGHSRRGLEHLCDLREGRSRQKNALLATKAVLNEQRCQTMVGHINEERLALVSLLNTTWARDLAHASGLADEEVALNKSSSQRKSRNDYVLQSLSNHHLHHHTLSEVKIHAADVIGINCLLRNNENCSSTDTILADANTFSNRVCRKRQLIDQAQQKLCDSSPRITHNSSESLIPHKPAVILV